MTQANIDRQRQGRQRLRSGSKHWVQITERVRAETHGGGCKGEEVEEMSVKTSPKRKAKRPPKPDDDMWYMNVGAAYVLVMDHEIVSHSERAKMLGASLLWTSLEAIQSVCDKSGLSREYIHKLHVITEEP